MSSKVKKMSAKDKAFEAVRVEYRHKIRKLESEVHEKSVKVQELDKINRELIKQHEEDVERWKSMEQFKDLSAHDIEVLLRLARASYDIIEIMKRGNMPSGVHL